MKARVLLMVALTLVMAGGLSVAPAVADDAVVPFKATYVTHPTPTGPPQDGVLTFRVPGEGQATHLGASTFYAEMWVDTNSVPAWTQGGTMTFAAANGDPLSGAFQGFARPTGPDSVAFWGTFEFSGDTGRFEGATASGTYWGSAEGNEGILYFDGMLTK